MSFLDLDQKIFYSINQLPHTPLLDKSALFLHYLTWGGLIYFVVLILLLASDKKGLKDIAKLGLASGMFSFLATDALLKNIFARPRPFQVLDAYFISPEPLSFSFPSGQTGTAFAIATVLLMIYPKKYFSFAALLFAALVAIDRIYMGHHYFSDVLAGAVIGIISGILAVKYKSKVLSALNNI